MGLFGYVAAFALFSLLTLEGLNPSLTGDAEKGAAGFVGLIGSQFKFDTKPVLAFLPHLKFIPLIALSALVIKSIRLDSGSLRHLDQITYPHNQISHYHEPRQQQGPRRGCCKERPGVDLHTNHCGGSRLPD